MTDDEFLVFTTFALSRQVADVARTWKDETKGCIDGQRNGHVSSK